MMGGTLDYPPVCSCCATVYGWGQAVKINAAVLDVWLADGWSLTAEPDGQSSGPGRHAVIVPRVRPDVPPLGAGRALLTAKVTALPDSPAAGVIESTQFQGSHFSERVGTARTKDAAGDRGLSRPRQKPAVVLVRAGRLPWEA